MSKTAIVTGGSSGIGLETAKKLAEMGFRVYALSRHPKAYPTFVSLECDVTDEKAVKHVVKKIALEPGHIDLLINAAGFGISGAVEFTDTEDAKRLFDTNFFGMVRMNKAVIPLMRARKHGRIINISSTNGMNTYYPMSFDYDASKAALISLTHDLAVQFGPYVHVNAVAPGFIGTESELDGYDEAFLREETEKILVKRYGRPEEVAYLVRFLISDEADYINNTVIRIDGGQQGSI